MPLETPQFTKNKTVDKLNDLDIKAYADLENSLSIENFRAKKRLNKSEMNIDQ